MRIPRAPQVGTALLLLCAAGAVVSAVAAIPVVAAADPAALGAETWRLIGYLAFAGLFVLLARDPAQPGLWVVTIAAKAALPLAALTFARRADDAGAFLLADGLVVVLLVVAHRLLTPSRTPEVLSHARS